MLPQMYLFPTNQAETCVSGQCICRRGYARDAASGGQCADVNECLSGQRSVCGINAFCKNLPGSYDCVCPQVRI